MSKQRAGGGGGTFSVHSFFGSPDHRSWESPDCPDVQIPHIPPLQTSISPGLFAFPQESSGWSFVICFYIPGTSPIRVVLSLCGLRGGPSSLLWESEFILIFRHFPGCLDS